MKNQLTAASLKYLMWESMQELKEGSLNPQIANAMASNCREILRVIRVQLQILDKTNQDATIDLIEFSNKKTHAVIEIKPEQAGSKSKRLSRKKLGE